MKTLLGILILSAVLTLGTLGVLAIWGIYPVSWTVIWKTGISALIGSVALAFAWQVGYTFFRRDRYDSRGRKAHRMN